MNFMIYGNRHNTDLEKEISFMLYPCKFDNKTFWC